MGYQMNVRGQDLHFKRGVQERVQELLDSSWPVIEHIADSKLKYGWSFAAGPMISTIELDDQPISWTDDMVQDMILLQAAGVRGYIEFYDDFANHFLYKLTNAGLEERMGRIVFTQKPGMVWPGK